jgi:hypothetical protein
MAEAFGFKAPTGAYYLHRGRAWALPEASGQVRVGLDAFSQRSLI